MVLCPIFRLLHQVCSASLNLRWSTSRGSWVSGFWFLRGSSTSGWVSSEASSSGFLPGPLWSLNLLNNHDIDDHGEDNAEFDCGWWRGPGQGHLHLSLFIIHIYYYYYGATWTSLLALVSELGCHPFLLSTITKGTRLGALKSSYVNISLFSRAFFYCSYSQAQHKPTLLLN